MKEFGHPERTMRSLNDATTQGLSLCTILDIEVGREYDDLTIRCKAFDGSSEVVVELMFNGIDVQILRVALAEAPPAAIVNRDSTEDLAETGRQISCMGSSAI